MNISRLWKTNHKLLKSSYLDEVDGVLAEKSFKVRYLGRTDVDQNGECNFNETAREIFAQYSPKSLKNVVQFDLFIDSKSVMICDNKRQHKPVVLFTIPLSNVRDVFYLKNDKRFGNVCIFVARDISDYPLKAHVLLCNNPEVTANVFQSFQNAFAIITATKKIHSGVNVSHQEDINTSFSDFICSKMAINKGVDSNLERKREGLYFDPMETNVFELESRKESDAFSSFAFSRAKTHGIIY